MKKGAILLVVFSIFLSINNLQAQEGPGRDGKVEIKAGIGGPNWLQMIVNKVPDGVEEGRKPIPVNGEISYYFSDQFSLGLYGSYFKINSDKYKLEFNYNDSMYVRGLGQLSLSRLAIAAKPTFHFGSNPKFDPYIAGIAGIRINNLKGKAELDAEVGNLSELEVVNEVLEHLADLGIKSRKLDLPFTLPIFGVQFGAKYYFTPNIGAFTEVGLGAVPVASAGVNFRF